MCHNLGISFVEDLNLNFTNNSSLTWSPPSFYSDDIPKKSITIYNIYVVNQDGSVIVDVNTTDTFYHLPSNFSIDCNSYNVSVIAFIEQYSSPATTIFKQNTGSKIILNIYYYKTSLHYQIILLTYIAIM